MLFDLGVVDFFEDDDFMDLFLEEAVVAGVVVVVVDLEQLLLAATDGEVVIDDDDGVTLSSYEAELSCVKIRSNANSTLNELPRNAWDNICSETFMPKPVTKSRRVDSLVRKDEFFVLELESVIFYNMYCCYSG